MAFVFRENRRHETDGQTDVVVQHLLQSPREEDRISRQEYSLEKNLARWPQGQLTRYCLIMGFMMNCHRLTMTPWSVSVGKRLATPTAPD